MMRQGLNRGALWRAWPPSSSICSRIRPTWLKPHISMMQKSQTRHQSSFNKGWSDTKFAVKSLYRKDPVSFSFALFCIAAGMSGIVYVTYTYLAIYEPINQNFPEPVAKQLRKAIYFSNYDPHPQKAIDFYQKALAVADEEGMNRFSDEVIGIKMTMAAVCEKNHSYENAIKVMEHVRKDCQKWIEVMGGKEEHREHRTRILKKIVSMNVKLGELYSNQYVGDLEAAERSLTEGVEIALGEQLRRQKEGAKAGEGDWLSREELSGSLESLAHHYEALSKHNLAAPLFLRAITLAPPPCHATVLMNNLASSLAQTSPDTSVGAPTSRAALISNARSWAEKALEVAAAVQPPERNEECNMGCAVATHNLGEFAEMEGLIEEAKKKYVEASSLSKAIGFREGEQQAENSLRRLGKKAR